MTLIQPFIPEDAWVGTREYRRLRLHKVFATNGDVLTYCSRWLRRNRVSVAEMPCSAHRCRLCEKASA